MSEFQEQKELVSWFRAKYPAHSRCLRLSLNGINLPAGRRGAMMMSQCKSQGLTLGESDLFFAIPNLLYHGLFIEMKAGKGKATQDQLDYLIVMDSLGYQTAVITGAEKAKQFIEDYMTTAPTIH